MQLQTWIVSGRTYPPEPAYPEFSHAQRHRPFSIAFFCPHCGDIWARRIVTGEGVDPEWVLWNKPCEKHPYSPSRGVAGSVYLPWDSDFTKHLPKALLQQEALLHIGAFNPPLSTPEKETSV